MSLEGMTALVTGATSGIGRGAASALAAEGASVIVTGRDIDRGAETVREIADAGGKARFMQADLSSLSDVRRLAKEAGAVDILVNNAAIFPFATTAGTDEATYDATFNTNVKAPFFLVGALAPKMAARGGGSIINVSSTAARRGAPLVSLYGSTKGAIDTLTREWAVEYGPLGIRVNAVAPGPTHTLGTASFSEAVDQFGQILPLQRAAKPAEIASVIVFLAQDKSSFITGEVIAVDGGMLALQPPAPLEIKTPALLG
ncbi:MAG TPA: glucose 1-dehydrogenase [Acidimicrobiales bacterium]|jgi:NAD(P)-dependent dehydrogenase (short-subunit alcohol dehydrogenase family)|nr:glucose 1-dehydrogenase [Acidimicrobiales bacterium]